MPRQPTGSDPLRQFCRDWGEGRFLLKFASEMNGRERDRLSLEEGERIIGRFPLSLVERMNAEERRDLARVLGRPRIRLAEERRQADKERAVNRPRAAPN